MGWFGRQSVQEQRPSEAAIAAIGKLFEPIAILEAMDKVVPQYLGRVDRGDLIYPACNRTLTDVDGNVRSIWEHTRIEAMRYVMMVPRRDVELLVNPARQPEMLSALLRQRPHEGTMVDFTGVPINDLVIAIIAGLNWLNHCALIAGVDPDKFSRTIRNFRKVAQLAEQWWALEGAGPRCYTMLARHELPPLTVYLIWQEYTRLAKEVATAAIYGSSIERAMARDREFFERKLANRPSELNDALAALTDTMTRLERARDPDDLLK
ncbi:MAG TPA: hypothetical protein VN941_10310 [Bradyrhizobium sp.]|nr:hypothetical protein [Bradyrhizobium sp.]